MASSLYPPTDKVNDAKVNRMDALRNSLSRPEYHCLLYSGYTAFISGRNGYPVESMIWRTLRYRPASVAPANFARRMESMLWATTQMADLPNAPVWNRTTSGGTLSDGERRRPVIPARGADTAAAASIPAQFTAAPAT